MQTIASFRANFVALWMVSVLGILLATAPAALAGPADEAEQIASLAGFHGGLVIHIGCGDGKLTAALRLADNCVVQGLDADAKRVEKARLAIREAGLYGSVSVIHWSEKKLPYVDNLASLVVCEDAGAVPPGELMRVLRPYGTAVVKRDGKAFVFSIPRSISLKAVHTAATTAKNFSATSSTSSTRAGRSISMVQPYHTSACTSRPTGFHKPRCIL